MLGHNFSASSISDAACGNGLPDERGVAGCRIGMEDTVHLARGKPTVATKDEGLRQHGEGMPSGTEACPPARLRQHRLDEAHNFRRRGQAVLDRTSPFYEFAAAVFRWLGFAPSWQALREVSERWDSSREFSKRAIKVLLFGGLQRVTA
jgi:hypothetical protein